MAHYSAWLLVMACSCSLWIIKSSIKSCFYGTRLPGNSKGCPPLFPDDNHVPEPTGYCNYGLDYDESSHQFKVIGFMYNERDKYNVVVKIYSVKDKGPLKRIKDHTGFSLFRSSFSGVKSTVCANRKIYWIGEHPSLQPPRSHLPN